MYVNEIVRVAAESIAEDDQSPLAVLSVAIPYFSVRMTALCVEKRELDVLQEFILRAVAQGLADDESIAGFLGIRSGEVGGELSSLMRELFVSQDSRAGAYVLTERGIAAISQTGLRRIVEREALCYLNGVTRSVELINDVLLPRRRIPSGTVFLPAVPARPPRINELDVSSVRASMVTARTPIPRMLEITKLGRVVRTSSLFLSGHLILRRGSHGVPAICAQGSQNSDLADVLGAHPAILGIKACMDADERRTRDFIRKHAVKALNITQSPPVAIRDALTHLIAYEDAPSDESEGEKAAFLKACSRLVDKIHWIAAVEWHLLLLKFTAEAAEKLLIFAPPFSPFFSFGELEVVFALAKRGVDVELVMSESQVRQLERDETFRSLLGSVKVKAFTQQGNACGFSCDGKRLVIALTRENVAPIGQYQSLFGVCVPDAANADGVLRHCAQSSGWALETG